ncbi:hypothetical protein EXIGLDRAFT_774900 [Exidia glandulosa HHB12029]|uniref:Uncharacterized protein n=1 Tax=Exidia glandulosa HHB12029 TaxID=1314781 RepID=A0A165E5N4_EXIGL|nr:hypothetical protein EXIGLDRAFT_774900 [Exidia glandulosa HHB12029]
MGLSFGPGRRVVFSTRIQVLKSVTHAMAYVTQRELLQFMRITTLIVCDASVRVPEPSRIFERCALLSSMDFQIDFVTRLQTLKSP